MGYLLFQPGWQFGEGDQAFFTGDLHPRGGQTPGRFALVRFSAEQRFSLPQQMNIFSVHHDRLDEVAADLGAVQPNYLTL